jgi:hypothetical protein
MQQLGGQHVLLDHQPQGVGADQHATTERSASWIRATACRPRPRSSPLAFQDTRSSLSLDANIGSAKKMTSRHEAAASAASCFLTRSGGTLMDAQRPKSTGHSRLSAPLGVVDPPEAC